MFDAMVRRPSFVRSVMLVGPGVCPASERRRMLAAAMIRAAGGRRETGLKACGERLNGGSLARDPPVYRKPRQSTTLRAAVSAMIRNTRNSTRNKPASNLATGDDATGV